MIHDQTKAEWDKYGCLVSNLPDGLRQRHSEIFQRAVDNARKPGRDPQLEPGD